MKNSAVVMVPPISVVPSKSASSPQAPYQPPALHLPPRAPDLIPFPDVRAVLGEGAGEDVAAIALSDEIEIVVRFGVEHRGDRRLAGVGDRPLGQAGHRLGVVIIHRDRKSTRLN